jgi:hypothetical protein
MGPKEAEYVYSRFVEVPKRVPGSAAGWDPKQGELQLRRAASLSHNFRASCCPSATDYEAFLHCGTEATLCCVRVTWPKRLTVAAQHCATQQRSGSACCDAATRRRCNAQRSLSHRSDEALRVVAAQQLQAPCHEAMRSVHTERRSHASNANFSGARGTAST